MKAKGWVILLAIVAFVAVATFWRLEKNNEPGEHDAFANCLSEKGVIMYGAYWCPHCQNQKDLFGNSFRYVNYVECSLPNKAGQTQECNAAGIKGYPTWEFADKSRISGEATFAQLEEKTGCRSVIENE